MEKLGREQIKQKNFVIFGCGNWGQNCNVYLEKCEANVIAFIDNDMDKIGQKKNNVIIYSPQKLYEFEDTEIVVAIENNEDVCNQLEQMNLSYWCYSPYFFSLYRRENYLYNLKDIKNQIYDLKDYITDIKPFKRDYIKTVLLEFFNNLSVKEKKKLAFELADNTIYIY